MPILALGDLVRMDAQEQTSAHFNDCARPVVARPPSEGVGDGMVGQVGRRTGLASAEEGAYKFVLVSAVGAQERLQA